MVAVGKVVAVVVVEVEMVDVVEGVPRAAPPEDRVGVEVEV